MTDRPVIPADSFGDFLANDVGLSPESVRKYTGALARFDGWLAARDRVLVGVCSEWVEEFVEAECSSQSSRSQLRTAVRRWCEWKGRTDRPWERPEGAAVEDLLRGFGDALIDERGLSPNTARVYVWQLQRVTGWLAERGEDPTAHVTAATVAQLVEEFGSSRTARAQLRASLRAWFGWLGRPLADQVLETVEVPAFVPAEKRWTRGEFVDHLLGLGLGPRTANNYAMAALHGDWFARSIGTDLYRISASQLQAWCATKPGSRSTRKLMQIGFRRWCEWKGRDDDVWRAIRVPPKPLRLPRPLELEEAQLMVKAARGWYPQGTAVMLGFGLALRASEIGGFRLDGLDEKREWYTLQGKRDVVGSIPVHPAIVTMLRRDANEVDGPWLFPGARGRDCVTGTTVLNWVRAVADAAGVVGVTTHRLRHTSLTVINDATGDLRATQHFARHKRSETTELYTRVTLDRLAGVVDALGFLTGDDDGMVQDSVQDLAGESTPAVSVAVEGMVG